MWRSADVSRPITRVFYLVLFVLNLLGTVLVYYPARKAGMVTDFSSLAEQLQTYGWMDIIGSWGFHAYIPFAYFFYKVIYTVANFDPLIWSWFYWIAHALVALGVFHLCQKWLEAGQIKASRLVPLGAMLLFLVHPYQAETIIWKVCFHYMVCAGAMIVSLTFYINYIQKRITRDLIFASLLFFLALCSKEFGYMTPVIALLIGISVNTSWKDYLFQICGSAAVVLISYISCTYVFVHRVIGHRDSDSFDVTRTLDYIDTAFHYIVKYLFFLRHWPHEWKVQYQSTVDQIQPVTLILFLIGALVWVFYSFKKKNKAICVVGAMQWSAIIAVLPACFLFFYTLGESENDRYGYCMMIFLTMVISYMLISYCGLLGRFVFSILILYCAFLTHKSSTAWEINAHVHDGLIESFRWYDAPEVYVINMPSNYQGRRLYRGCKENSSFLADLKWLYDKPYYGKWHELGQYNMVFPDQGFIANKAESGILQGEMAGWGSWWTYCNLGGHDYATEDFSVDFTGKRIKVIFKRIADDAILIYHTGDQWHELDRSKL